MLMLSLSGVSALGGCGESQHTLTARQLAVYVIDAPNGYTVDPTKGASGQITPQVFNQFGGSDHTSASGFIAGFRQNYVDSGTAEGLVATVLEFSSPAKASTYMAETAHQTLSFAAATYSPFGGLTGAVEASGTKTYNGNYVHGVSAATGRYYFQLVYESPDSNAVPIEFASWVKIQWAILQPGVKVRQPRSA